MGLGCDGVDYHVTIIVFSVPSQELWLELKEGGTAKVASTIERLAADLGELEAYTEFVRTDVLPYCESSDDVEPRRLGEGDLINLGNRDKVEQLDQHAATVSSAVAEYGLTWQVFSEVFYPVACKVYSAIVGKAWEKAPQFLSDFRMAWAE